MSASAISPADMPDRSAEVPDLIPYLRPGEKVIRVEHAPVPRFEKLPDYRQELARLCRVDKPADIGKNGPVVASRSTEDTPGQKLFECYFGRDGLIVALNVFEEFPLLLRATLIKYAELMGMRRNRQSEEEYGRIIHEAREPDDPIAQQLTLENGWEWPFYASVDATLLFIKGMYHYMRHSGEGRNFLEVRFTSRTGKTLTMHEALKASLSWTLSRVHANPQYFVEYWPAFDGSHVNQVMEDSWDSHCRADGTLAHFPGGVASTEVQALAFDALYQAVQAGNLPLDHADIYNALRSNVIRYLWQWHAEGAYLTVGCDRDEGGMPRPFRVRKAIPYFALDSDLFSPSSGSLGTHVEACVRAIFSKKLLGYSGVRSLAVDEPRYMPGSYHNGNSWIMQTFGIAEGLRRHGYHHLAAELDRRIVRAVDGLNIYPEFVGDGEIDGVPVINERIVDTWDDIDQRVNRRVQPPQQMQAWTVSAYGAIKFLERQGRGLPEPRRLEEEILSTLES